MHLAVRLQDTLAVALRRHLVRQRAALELVFDRQDASRRVGAPLDARAVVLQRRVDDTQACWPARRVCDAQRRARCCHEFQKRDCRRFAAEEALQHLHLAAAERVAEPVALECLVSHASAPDGLGEVGAPDAHASRATHVHGGVLRCLKRPPHDDGVVLWAVPQRARRYRAYGEAPRPLVVGALDPVRGQRPQPGVKGYRCH